MFHPAAGFQDPEPVFDFPALEVEADDVGSIPGGSDIEAGQPGTTAPDPRPRAVRSPRHARRTPLSAPCLPWRPWPAGSHAGTATRSWPAACDEPDVLSSCWTWAAPPVRQSRSPPGRPAHHRSWSQTASHAPAPEPGHAWRAPAPRPGACGAGHQTSRNSPPPGHTR